MKNKKILIAIISIIMLILIIIFIKNNYNFSKTGNNISNKSADEIKEYILNIDSYYAIAEVTIKSNKNENTYKLKQEYSKSENTYKQEVLEPEHIAGVQFIYGNNNLKIENTKLSLSKIYENYNYVGSNELSLSSFIEDYSESENTKCYEENGKVILEAEIKNNNKYRATKKLYINKNEGKIEKMEIIDEAQTGRIYILYNEIELNAVKKEEIVAFSIKPIDENI